MHEHFNHDRCLSHTIESILLEPTFSLFKYNRNGCYLLLWNYSREIEIERVVERTNKKRHCIQIMNDSVSNDIKR